MGAVAIVGAKRVVTRHFVSMDQTVLCRGGTIEAIGPAQSVHAAADAAVLDATGLTLLPGFLDVHVHGGGGADTMDATPEALRAICRTHATHGTTGLLATTITQSDAATRAALANAHEAVGARSEFCPDGAQVLGVHLEGPYISPQKPGAQPKEFVRDYDAGEFARWLEIADGAISLITIAPERPGADALIAACRAAGVVVSIGHTDADAAQTHQAIELGASHATHLFNAMPAIHHRHPGPIPVMLNDDRVRVELIADGQHLAPEVVSMALRASGNGRFILITDAIRGAGMGDGVYDLGGQPATVANGRATLADGTLAGSVLTMDRAASNLAAWTGADWPTVVAATSANAAEEMGWKSKGRVEVGADADLVLVDDAFNVHATFVAGRCVYRKD